MILENKCRTSVSNIVSSNFKAIKVVFHNSLVCLKKILKNLSYSCLEQTVHFIKNLVYWSGIHFIKILALWFGIHNHTVISKDLTQMPLYEKLWWPLEATITLGGLHK